MTDKRERFWMGVADFIIGLSFILIGAVAGATAVILSVFYLFSQRHPTAMAPGSGEGWVLVAIATMALGGVLGVASGWCLSLRQRQKDEVAGLVCLVAGCPVGIITGVLAQEDAVVFSVPLAWSLLLVVGGLLLLKLRIKIAGFKW